MQGISRLCVVSMTVAGVLFGAGFSVPAQTSSMGTMGVRVSDQLKQADQMISVERLEEALSVLKAINPQTSRVSAKVDVLLGKIYQRLHKPAKAADLFEKAVFSSMDDAEAYLGLAEAKLALGQLRQARQHARVALKTNPDLIRAHLVLARVDDRTGQMAKAKERFSNLLQNKPSSEPVVVAYAQFLSEREDINSAIKVLKTFVDKEPFTAEASDLLGQLYWQQNRQTDALQMRTFAAKSFQALGNEFKANAVKGWISAHDPSGQYIRQLKAGHKPEFKSAPVHSGTVPPPPKAAPVPRVDVAKLPEIQRPTPVLSKVLKRPDPLPLPNGAMLKTGSGFIINDGKYVITNHHVIANTGKIAIRNGNGEVRTARVIKIARDDDLAILELSKPFPDTYSIPYSQMNDARTGRAAVVMGFPMAGIIGWQQPSLTEGIVSKSSGFNDNPNTFQITSKMNKGNSGGPIFDRQGRLIGIAVAKLNTTKIYEQKGSLPEDVNLAIKVGRLLKFLDIPVNTSEKSSAPELSLEDLYQLMLAKVVLVAAEEK